MPRFWLWRHTGLVLGLQLATAYQCFGQCPLPRDISISPPAQDAPADVAEFSGAWGRGAWGGQLPTFVVVESVRTDGTAKIIYSWGKSPQFDAGWIRFEATISGGHLRSAGPSGPALDFWLDGNDGLYGLYTRGQRPTSVELHRLGTTDAATVLAAAATPVPTEWTEIEIPEHSRTPGTAGDLTLRATLYRNPDRGRHPLVIFNHGSTGPGIIPASLVDRAWEPALVFQQLGYSIVVPMRKGRGHSGGSLIEESADDPAVQLAAAVEDLDAVVTFMQKESYVDPSRIVLAGQSRGGFLAVVYGGRHPGAFEGIVSFSGGWFGEHMPAEAFNGDQFRAAGKTGQPPMLWLCAEHDSFYSPRYVSRQFSGFKAAGGVGQLVTFTGIPGEGHFLLAWPQMWRPEVRRFLESLKPSSGTLAGTPGT